MSRPELPGEPRVYLSPQQQVKYFADAVSKEIKPETYARLVAHMQALGLKFTDDELLIVAALDTPARVQEFLNIQIYYNNDHATPDMEETALSPRAVLKMGHAHCFEGAMFAYTVNFLHGHSPRLVMLEASQDSEHNLVLYRDPSTGLYGANAHSAFESLDGRPAQYATVRALAESYYPYYYSDRTMNPEDLTLVGYSDPFDLTTKLGVGWMDSEEPLWDLYYTYIDDTIVFHYLFDDSNKTHLYPLIQALVKGWIQMDENTKPFVNVKNLPPLAQELWTSFFKVYDSSDLWVRPRGAAREIEKQFMQLTGTTPLDLLENADELQKFVERGYQLKELTSP
ncbi:MAG: hypothetical protein HY707_06875 [Ignavibacteriae bacterium]|nr:hypothetical protein [Ignavibacteriota bacterium]